MLEGFQGDRRFACLTAGPLSRAEHAELVGTLLGGTATQEDLVEQLYERAEGNPFLIRELVRSLIDAGTIVQDDSGSWALAVGVEIGTGALPATI